jgi:hypothetical protein
LMTVVRDNTPPEPIGPFLTCLLQLLAEEDTALRPFAAYFASAGLFGVGHARPRRWILKDTPADERALIARLQAAQVQAGVDESSQLPDPGGFESA